MKFYQKQQLLQLSKQLKLQPMKVY